MTSDASPEDIIKNLGGCGRYQICISTIGHLMKIVFAWSISSMVLYAKTPSWKCDVGITTNSTLNYGISTPNILVGNSTSIIVQSIDQSNQSSSYESFKSCVSSAGNRCKKYTFSGVSTVVSEFDLVCDLAYVPSLMMSMQGAGSLAGNLIAGQLSDLFGRKRPLFGSIVCVTLSNIVGYFANSWALFTASRFFIGLGISAFLTSSYSLLCEFSLAQHRTWIVGFPSWPIETSLFAGVSYLLKEWKYIQIANIITGLPFLLTWWIMPESFRWYLAHDRKDDAVKVLRKVAGVNKKEKIKMEQLESLSVSDTIDVGDRKYTFVDIFKSKHLIKITLLMIVNWFSIGYITYGIMFGVQELSGDLYLNTFLFSCVGIPAKFLIIWLENRIGRKKSAFLCFFIVAIGGFIAGILSYVETPHRGALINGFALLASCGYSMAWGPIQTLTIELYPTVVRTIGFGTLSVFARVGSIIGPQFVYLSTKVPGLMFLLCGVFATLSMLTLLGLDETMNARLNDKISERKRTVQL